ncbi:hypothetical protein Q3G72_002357 [Acer saccharum]|nr:hypothetical protein Q3G72_002357 [Acer saccharum]
MYAQTHPEKSDGSFYTSEEEDETDLECGPMINNVFLISPYEEGDKTNQDGFGEIHGDQWKIISENGCEVKVISEDYGLEWIIDPQTGQIISTNQSVTVKNKPRRRSK